MVSMMVYVWYNILNKVLKITVTITTKQILFAKAQKFKMLTESTEIPRNDRNNRS